MTKKSTEIVVAGDEVTQDETMLSPEVGDEGMTETAYLINAATDDRYGLPWSNEMAIVLLNQVGVLVGERLEDLTDLMKAIFEHHLSVKQILKAYYVSEEELEFWEGDLEKMLEIAWEHLREKVAIGILKNAGAEMGVDHTIKVTEYRGAYGIGLAKIFGRGTENDEAYPTAFLTPFEAYKKILQARDVGRFDYELGKVFVRWCRQTVGLPEDLVPHLDGDETGIAGLLEN